MAVSGEIFCI